MRRFTFRLLFFVLVTIQLSVFNFAQTEPEQASRPLGQAKPVERELKGGEVHAYTFKLEAGQFGGIVVDQRGIDVAVSLFAPDGKRLAEVDSPNGTKGPEPVSLVAKTTGEHRIEIRSLEKSAAAGRYEVKVEALRAATIEDKADDLAVRLVAAKSAGERAALMTEQNLPPKELLKALGNLSDRSQKLRDFAPALGALLIARQVAEQNGDKAQIAKVLLNIGGVYRLQRDSQKALEFFQKSIAISEDLKDQEGIAKAWNNTGLLYHAQQNYEQAFAAYHKSLAASEAAGLKPIMAQTTYSLGIAYEEQGDYVKALEYLQKSLALNEALGDKRVMSFALQAIGNTYEGQADYAKALEAFQRSLALYEESGNKNGIALVFNGMGNVYVGKGDYTKALDMYQKGLAIIETVGDKPGTISAISNIGAIYYFQGDYSRAAEFHQRALAMAEATGDKRLMINTLVNLGLDYEGQGDYQQTIEHYQKGLKLSEEIGYKIGMAKALANIAGVFAAQGNDEQALDYEQRALQINEQIGNKQGVGLVLNNIGLNFDRQGKYDQALEYFQKSLASHEAIGNKLGAATSLENTGSVYHARRNYPQAMEIYRKVLARYEELGSKYNIAQTLTNIAVVLLEQDEYAKALEFSRRSADTAKQINSPELLWKAKTTSGKSYLALKQYDEADKSLSEAVKTIEFIRSNFSGNEARASYLATVLEPYQLYIDLLMQRHKQNPSDNNNAAALQTSERARARSLLESLSEARADIRRGVDPQLLRREKSLQQQLNARAERQTRLLSGKYTEEQAAILKKEIDALTAEYQNIEAQIKRSSPRYAALTQPEPLSLSEIQQEVLDRETVLLEYALGEKRSYLWAVTKDSIKSHELPPRAEIEAAVRRVYTLVSDGKLVIDNKSQAEYERDAARLSEMLLAPVAAQLQNKRILLVADGALQYLPFGVLPNPKSKTQNPKSKNNNGRPLIVENEIVNLPSASTLVSLRRQAQGRTAASKTLAVLADPVFSPNDARVKTTVTNAAASTTQPSSLTQNTIIERTAKDVGVLREGIIQRLPFSRREAESILATVPAGEKKQALDFEANRATALNPEMSQYRIIHFATHGLLHSEHPELSGIVLSLVNEQGRAIDGFLRLNEIYNLNLSADLVVLSACQTALGKEIKGEGLVGLTRGFMYAGSPRVVASLWKVDDVATAELMKLFYQKMLQEKMRPAAALRAAKVEMWKQKRWSAPFYWAAFELQGEWK